MIGGLLVALVAPVVFADVYEYPVVLALVAALVPAATFAPRRVHLIVAGIAPRPRRRRAHVRAFQIRRLRRGRPDADPHRARGLVVLAAPALLVLRTRPLLLAGALLVVFLAPEAIAPRTDVHVAGRTLFLRGVSGYRSRRRTHLPSRDHSARLAVAASRRLDREPDHLLCGSRLPYGELLSALTRRPSPVTIGMVGLGTGSLACYARPGRLRAHLRDRPPSSCALRASTLRRWTIARAEATIAVGDARLLLERERVQLDILALDAFTSDAIPVHLLTLRGVPNLSARARPGRCDRGSYQQPASGSGASARRAGRAHRPRRAHQTLQECGRRASLRIVVQSSHVVVLARDESALQALDLDSGWAALGSPDRVRVWTDDYASIVPILRWW